MAPHLKRLWHEWGDQGCGAPVLPVARTTRAVHEGVAGRSAEGDEEVECLGARRPEPPHLVGVNGGGMNGREGWGGGWERVEGGGWEGVRMEGVGGCVNGEVFRTGSVPIRLTSAAAAAAPATCCPATGSSGAARVPSSISKEASRRSSEGARDSRWWRRTERPRACGWFGSTSQVVGWLRHSLRTTAVEVGGGGARVLCSWERDAWVDARRAPNGAPNGAWRESGEGGVEAAA